MGTRPPELRTVRGPHGPEGPGVDPLCRSCGDVKVGERARHRTV